ncbi:hypothetical protein EGT74_25050 [Chitinophaga lutea]|uniref:Bacterial Ig-like domain-containing protein n=1 Tax=Chitinophaga lutea TaxID=2488634 RepID=A0A3N4PBN2_9BACT|nr:Ig-like domain-containing protein [Chitinophaga lutea]RPE05646.1 hypothetical protein EGT74_25050 [Chitinophaga lutea]
MKNMFVKSMKPLLLLCSMLACSIFAMAQYNSTVLETGKYYCAVTRDQQNNVYLVRYNSTAGKYEVAKYVNGDPANVISIYSNLSFGATEFPWGIAVNANGDVFVTNPNPANQWEIVKLAHNAGVYTPSVIQTGKYYSALAVDIDNNLLVMEYYAGPPTRYRLMRYQAGQEHMAGVEIYNGLTYTAGVTFTYPWGIITDAQRNIYILDMWENSGGRVIKLPYPGYAPATPVTTGRSFSSIAIDGKGYIYTIEGIEGGDGSTAHVMKYKDITQPGTELFTGLTNVILGYPWGIAVNSTGNVIHVNDGSGAGGIGRFLQLAPQPVSVASILPAGSNPTAAASVSFTVVFSGLPDEVTSSAFSLTTTGLTGSSITGVSGSGNVYTVTVATGTGDGTIRLDVNGTGIINPLVNIPYTGGTIYNIDRTGPTGSLQINSGAAATNSPNVTLNITGTDVSTPLEMAFSNGAGWTAYEPFAATKAWTLPAGDGVKNVSMRLRDRAGNVNTATISDDITLDQIPPSTTIVTSPPSNSSSTSATFEFGSNETGATFEVSLDGSAFAAASNPVTFAGLVTGPHTINVRAKDQAGNVDPTPEPYTWNISILNPGVTSVAVPANGYYKVGNALNFTVNFNANVTVNTAGGTPYIGVTIGTDTKQAGYAGGSGTSMLTFVYIIQPGDNDMNGIALAPSVTLNGGTMQSALGGSILSALNNTGSTSGILVNTQQPTVTLSTVATSPVNQRFFATATFSEAVTGFTMADISTTNASLSGLSTSDNITYTFEVIPVAAGNLTVEVPANRASNVAGNPNTVSNTLTLTYDADPPAVANVAVPASGNYKSGDVLHFTVNFNENVVVTGTPSLPVIIGGNTRQAAYSAGSGTQAFVFSYTIQAGELDQDGIALGASIALNGGTIKDAATNNATLTLNNAGSSAGVLVDAVAPVVLSVTVPAPGYYKTGGQLDFIVQFSEPVGVTVTNGIPYLTVHLASGDVSATLISHTGAGALTFRYQVTAADLDLDGITLGNSVMLGGGVLNDAAGNMAVPALQNIGNASNVYVYPAVPSVQLSGTPSLNAPFTVNIGFSEAVTGFIAADISATNATIGNLQTADNITYTAVVTPVADGLVNISVPANMAFNIAGTGNTASNAIAYTYDGTAPVVASVAVPANGYYKAGDVLQFTVNYSENVMVNTSGGAPTLGVSVGGVTRQAGYTGGDGTSALTFAYTVQNGELDTDGIALGGALQLNGAGIRDASGNHASLALANAGNLGAVRVDAVAPVIYSVGIPADGYYKTDDQLSFTVVFSEPVTVVTTGGLPYIDLTLGAATVRANYTSGSGTNVLLFRYRVQAGDQDTDGIVAGNSIIPDGGTLRDVAGNDALPALQNVGNTGNVFVYSRIPAVALLTDNLRLNAPFPLSIVFSEAVTGFAAADIVATNAVISNLQTSDNITYTALVTPVAEGGVSLQVPANAAVNIANRGNTLSNVISYYYDGTAPAVSSVTVPANGYYKAGDVLNFTVNYSENVTVNTTGGIPSLSVIIGSSTRQAVFTGGSGSSAWTFRYTVQDGEMDMDGIAITGGLSMNGAVARDASGNTALTTLNNTGSTAGVFVNTAKPSVTVSTAAPARVNAPFTATLVFSEAVTGLTAGEVTLTNGTGSNLQTANNITYTLLITPAADGPVSIHVPAAAAVNIAGNGNTASNTVSVNYDGTAPVITAGQAFTTSQNSTVGTVAGKVTATEAVGTLQNWTITNDGSGGAFAIDATGNITVKDAAILAANAGRTVAVSVTISDGLNTSAPVPVTITINFVNKAPAFNTVADAAVCASTTMRTIQVTGATATEPGQTYAFTISSNQPYFDVLSVNAAGLISYQLKNTVTSGQATITLTIKDNGGTANGGVDAFSRNFTITINSLPAISISSNKGGTISKGDVVLLTASGAATYSWANADGIISGQQQPVLEAKPMATTTYQVTGTTADGCNGTGNIQITVLEDFKVDATNILTPNGDGRNDKWVIRNIGSYPDNELKIYDRAGRIVYTRRNYNNEWDGMVNGNPLAEGTYYYILIINGGAKTAKGYITIVRDRN